MGRALLELRTFESVREAEALAEHLHGIVESNNKRNADLLYKALCETGANVLDHSRVRHGYLMAQMTHGGDLVHFAVGDAGVGMLATLRELGAVDDSSALDLASATGVSATRQRGRGNGLRDLADQATRSRGEVTVQSGSATRSERGRTGAAPQITRRSFAHAIHGTLISGSLGAA